MKNKPAWLNKGIKYATIYVVITYIAYIITTLSSSSGQLVFISFIALPFSILFLLPIILLLSRGISIFGMTLKNSGHVFMVDFILILFWYTLFIGLFYFLHREK